MAVNDVVPLRYVRNPLIPTDSEGQILYLASELDKISAMLASLSLQSSSGSGTPVEIQVKEFIATQTSSTAAGFDFDGMDFTGYNSILAEGRLWAVSTGISSDPLRIFFNGDNTPANYDTQIFQGNNGTTIVSEASTSEGFGIGTTAGPNPARAPTEFVYTIPNPAGTDKKWCRVEYGLARSDGGGQVVGMSLISNDTMTAPLTRLRFNLNTANPLTGPITLYGIKTITVNAL